MAAPTLTGLPIELLDEIIQQAILESFKSLSLTCKLTHGLCKRYAEQHKRLSSQFRNFTYTHGSFNAPSALAPFDTGIGLLTRIAAEPIITRYMKDGDFFHDSFPPRIRQAYTLPDIDSGDPLVALFANSPYLREADVDWKEYYALIQEDLRRPPTHYSQHLAAFILTLLPNIEVLTLPRYWTQCPKSLDKTDELLSTIIRKAVRSNLPLDTPSLAHVTELKICHSVGSPHIFQPDKAIPFLALPRLRSLCAPFSIAESHFSTAIASEGPDLRYGENLETVTFEASSIDEVAIANFLKHTPRLRTLTFSFTTGPRPTARKDWDLCKFITAVEREVGSHLEEFYITKTDCTFPVIPGRTSMRGFKRLRKLGFPLEVVLCNIADAAPQSNESNGDIANPEPENQIELIDNLLPASISQLSLVSSGTESHKKATDVIFSYLASRKRSQVPNLKEIHFKYARDPLGENMFDEVRARLTVQAERAGLVLQCIRTEPFGGMLRQRGTQSIILREPAPPARTLY